jgi:hypothetical protein
MSSTPSPAEMSRDELEQEVQRLREIEATQRELLERVAELETRLEDERAERQALIDYQTAVSAEDASLEQVFVAGKPLGSMVVGAHDRLNRHADTHDELREAISEEATNRGRQDAKIRRRLSAVASEADVDITDSDLLTDDKVKRVITHGPEDVVDRVTNTHLRARDLLVNLPTWGTTMSDQKGRRVAITSPDARRQLETHRDETLQSGQIRRVFEQIDAWGAESPRTVSADFSGDVNKLVVLLEVGDDS